MSSPSLIDSHVHFWDLKHPTLRWGWLDSDAVHPILGDIDPIKTIRFDADAFAAESRFAGVVGAVHVQAAVGTPEPVEETQWLTEMAVGSPVPFVIIAGVDLSAEDVEQALDAHAASALFRGVRDYGRIGFLDDPAFYRGARALERRGLVLDLDVAWEDMPQARRIADDIPSLKIAVDHMGYPRDTMNPDYFDSWRRGVTELAKAQNIVMKISGFGMNREGWTTAGVRPWAEHVIEAFGPDRCMWGSNWPVDRLYASYDAYANAFRVLVSGYSVGDQTLMASAVAQKLFRIPGLERPAV